MKNLFLTLMSFCGFATVINLQAQTCAPYEGLKVIVLQYGINYFGQQATQAPFLSDEGRIYLTNHLITWNETTGQLESQCSTGFGPAGSILGSEHYGSYCSCIVPGPVFRSVNYACPDDINTCGNLNNYLPVTDRNTTSTDWSSSATWMNNTYPDLPTAPAIFITKSINIDVDIDIDANRWIVVSNSGAATINAGITLTNNSVIQVRPNGFFQNNGTIKGSGQVQGSFTNNSILDPGNSPGIFSITGNYTATGNAVHQVEIATLSSFDQIKVGGDWTTVAGDGNAIINGALNVSLLNGYTPSLGDTYKIFTFVAGTGNFTSTNFPALPAGLGWHIQYNVNDITLEIINCIPQTYYADVDGDGFGDLNNSIVVCSPVPPVGYVSNSLDCDDTKITYADIDGDGFGAGANTPCGVANNTDCNDNPYNGGASIHSPQTYYADSDGDGFGDLNNLTYVCSSTPPVNYVSNSLDCDDTQTTYADNDGDGFGAGVPTPCGVADDTDWDDKDPNIHTQPTCTPTTSATFKRSCGSYSWNGTNYTSSGTYVYHTNNAGGCDSTATLILTIVTNTKPATPAPISGPTNVCPFIGMGTATYSVQPVPANVLKYRWTLPGAVSVVSATDDSSGITVNFATNFVSGSSIKVKAIGCSGSSADKSLTLSAPKPSNPGSITATSTNACLYLSTGAEDTLRIKKVVNATSYQWTLPTGANIASHPGGAGINDTIITVTFNSFFVSGTSVSVSASAACGNSVKAAFKAIVKTNPAVPGSITGPLDICPLMVSAANPTGTEATYTIRKVTTASSYNWVVPAGATLDAHPGGSGTANDTIIKVTFGSAFTNGTIRVKAVNGCNTSNEKVLVVSKFPVAPVISGNSKPCPSTNEVYTVPAATGTTFTWSVASAVGTIVSGQGTNTLTVSIKSNFASGSISAKAITMCGTSPSKSFAVSKCNSTAAREAIPITTITTENSKLDFTIYPNPSDGNFNIAINGAIRKVGMDVQVEIVSAYGQDVYRNTTKNSNGIIVVKMDGRLANGMYMVHCTINGEKIVRRIYINR